MKILFLNHNFMNFGTYYRCFFLGKQLSRMGNDVTILCASSKSFDFSTSISTIDERFRVITLPRTSFHKYYTGHFKRMILGSLQTLVLDYDILHSFAVAQPTTAVPTVISRIFKDKPIVVDWDDAWGDGFAEYHNIIVGKTLKCLEKNVPRVANKITVVSEYLKQRALGYNFKMGDIIKIPNGANVEFIRPLDKREARNILNIEKSLPIIISVGHSYMGNLGTLFKAFSRVNERRPVTKMFMIGRVEVSAEIRNEYKSIFKNVVFAGEQPFEKIPYYLSAADVLVLPMGDSVIEKARWPIRFGDYLASGRPIVSNAVGEVKNIIEEEKCGLASFPSNVEEFAEDIIKVLDDEVLQEKLGQAARRAAEEKYSWGKIAGKLMEVYQGEVK